MQENVHRVVILGSGPAGLTAGIYCARALLEPLIIEGPQPGGQLMITSEVENFPGFPEGILGPSLMDNMRQQAARFGASFMMDELVEVAFDRQPLRLIMDSEKVLYTKSLIIASGASAKWLNLDSEKALRGRGVSSCATCDGFFFRDKEVAVVGGGDSALEDALFLTRFARKVTIIHRRDELRGSQIMQKRAFDHAKIEFCWDSVVDEILPNKDNSGVAGVRLRKVKTAETFELPLQGIFIAIGHVPNTAVFRGHLEMEDAGYIVVREGTRTSVQGVFAAGDVRDSRYRQAVVAAGFGCMAGIDAERFVAEQEE